MIKTGCCLQNRLSIEEILLSLKYASTCRYKFDELLKIVKNLPEAKLSKLKAEVEKETKQDNNRDDFEKLLLNGPTFSKKQLSNIARTRKAINQWRTK